MTLPKIGITMGDPAGIGPEICLQTLALPAIRSHAIPVLFGDASVLFDVSTLLDLDFPNKVLKLEEWQSGHPITEPCIVDFNSRLSNFVPGQVSDQTGAASYRYIETAIDAAQSGRIDAVVTGPVNKEALSAAGVPFPGHTEILAAKTDSDRICMMLTSDELTCSLVTTHVGYVDVPQLLTIDRIVEVIELSHETMRRLRNRTPRLTVCGLNPHGGESGLFGRREEERIIAPAVEIAKQNGFDVVGPIPPDTAFVRNRRASTDCYICMYHDQGLIPLKALAFDYAVNVTLGIPIVRTSVDHGTACDIAWQGVAENTSMVEAIHLAARLAVKEPLLSS